MESSLRIVAITNCPAGIAHTYMVAEALEQKARSLGHTIKVETQGSSGVENRLSCEEIAAADYVILATGRGLSGDDRARFAGKKVYEIAISQALKNIDHIFSELPTNSQLFAADSGVKLGKQEVQSGSVMSHLMAGVSAALPFVIGGGILVALANMLVQFGLPYTDMSKGAPSFTWVVESIGYLGFTFMIPIMGAYIASSIADKPAFAPAFLVCYLANDKALLGTQSGAGFLGAVVLGLAIGYFVFWFRKVRLGKALQPLLGSMLIPFVTLLVFGVLTYYVYRTGDVRSHGRAAALPEHHPSINEVCGGVSGRCDAGVRYGRPHQQNRLVLLLLTAGKTHLRLVRHRRRCRANAACRGGSCDVHCAQTVYSTGKRSRQ